MHDPAVTWSLLDAAAGPIGSGGLFSAGLTSGTYLNVIQATSGTKSDTATVTIVYLYLVYLPLALR